MCLQYQISANGIFAQYLQYSLFVNIDFVQHLEYSWSANQRSCSILHVGYCAIMQYFAVHCRTRAVPFVLHVLHELHLQLLAEYCVPGGPIRGRQLSVRPMFQWGISDVFKVSNEGGMKLRLAKRRGRLILKCRVEEGEPLHKVAGLRECPIE
jgi:hypothetical protein